MNGKREELKRRAEDVRDFILDVCYDVDLPIGPLLDAYGNAVAELVQEERRIRRTTIAKRLAARLRAVLWLDERRLLRKLGPLAGPFADLAVAVARREISSKRAAEVFSEQLTRLFKENPDPKHPYFVFDIDVIERCLIGFADRIGELLHTRALDRDRREL